MTQSYSDGVDVSFVTMTTKLKMEPNISDIERVTNFPVNTSIQYDNESVVFGENYTSTPDYDYESFTEYTEYIVAEFINNYYLYVVCAIGVPGNIACIVTLTFMGNKISSSFYMTALAVADLTAIALKLAYLLLTKHDIRLGNNLCQLIFMLGTASQMYSNWILVVMTIERFIAIWFPFKVRKLCTRWHSIITLVVLFVIFILANLQFVFTFEEVKDPFMSWDCRPKEKYRKFIQVVWYWIDGALYAILPIILILVLNSLIIYAVRKSSRAQRTLINRIKQPVERSSHQNQVTVMLLTTSITFIILVMPNCVFFIAREYWTWNHTNLGIAQYYLVYQIVFLLSDLNHAVNFYLYCLSGRKFRQKFMQVLCLRKQTARGVRVPSIYSAGIPRDIVTSRSTNIATVSTPTGSPIRHISTTNTICSNN